MKQEAEDIVVEPSQNSVADIRIIKVRGQLSSSCSDLLAVEEPLEIRLNYQDGKARVTKPISITMRTPGKDEELASGFLFTEGIISSFTKITDDQSGYFRCAEGKQNIVTLTLEDGFVPKLDQSDRNFYTTSSCGVCGKSSIASIRTVSSFSGSPTEQLQIPATVLLGMPAKLKDDQRIFSTTGGLHGCAIFSAEGELLLAREDVGRHNALDKLIGRALIDGLLPLSGNVLLLSGRASFELVQKAAMAGITVVAAIGAPSSLAVELAQEFNITLLGFLRAENFNIYCGAHRVNNNI